MTDPRLLWREGEMNPHLRAGLLDLIGNPKLGLGEALTAAGLDPGEMRGMVWRGERPPAAFWSVARSHVNGEASPGRPSTGLSMRGGEAPMRIALREIRGQSW